MKLSRFFLQLVAIATVLIAGGQFALAQATSDIPLVIRNNGTGVNAGQDTLRFGVNPAGTNGKDAALGEIEQPPAPPSAVFDIRWINVGTSNNFGEGVKKNYRASTSPTQRDTFRIKFQAGTGGFPVNVSWPNLTSYFGTAELRYFDNNLGANVSVNMNSATSASITDDQVTTLTIYTFSPTAPASGVSVTPSPLNMGIVGFPIPGTKTDSITITNTGALSATVDSIRSTNASFQIATPPATPFVLAPGASQKVGVVFTAAGTGVQTSTIRVYHNQAGSPTVITASATVSSGEGLYLLNNLNTVYDNHAGVYRQIVGLKYSGTTGAQGLQFKITAPTNVLKITGVSLGSSVANPANWNFDYEITNAASGSEALVILYGKDTTVKFDANTFDSVFVVRFDVKNIAVCNGGPSGDTIRTWMYLNSIQSSLANGIGTSAGIGADPDRDSSQYNVQNSSARGDVNCDDRVDILDVLDIIDVILGRATFAPWQKNRADLAPWNLGWGTGLVFNDANNYGDNAVNVQDVTLITNAILNEKWPDNTQLFHTDRRDDVDGGGDGVTPTTSASPGQIFDVKLTYRVTSAGINVEMNNLVPVKGIQMKLKANAPADLKAQLLSSLGDKFTVQEKIVDGEIRLLIYSLSGDAISPSTIALLDLPFTINDASSVVVVEPIIIGGSHNEGLLVEYEVIQSVSGVDHQGVARSFNFTTSPNPIDRAGVISYTLANSSSVTLSVADVTGKVVARLINGERQSAGAHLVNFDASGLSNGTYYCTISADGVSTSRTMVVVR